MTSSDDRALDHLLAVHRPEKEAGPCPDAGLVAALAEGRLEEEEAADLRLHLAGCEDCRLALAALVDVDSAAPAPRRLAGRPVIIWAAAAVLAMALGLGALGLLARHGDSRTTTMDALLAAAPDVFEGFELLSVEDLAAPPGNTRRGGVRVLQPRGRVLTTRPTLAWRPVRGVSTWRVAVDGVPLAPVEGQARTPWPADRPGLEPGPHVLTLEAEGPVGSLRSTRAFEVADGALRARWSRAQDVIGRLAPADEQALLLAHFAIRERLYAEAWAHVQHSPPGGSVDGRLEATRAWLAARLGREP